jgi:hypothetical protein
MAKFLKESEMTPAVAAWLEVQGLVVRREFSLPWGICDLVAASLDRERVKKRIELRQREAVGPMSRVSVLLSLPDVDTNVAASFREIQAKLGGFFSEGEIAAELAVLTRKRFVRVDGNGYFQKVNGWIPLNERLIAVELKLDRVADALSQARKNKEVTWESYVALPVTLARAILGGKKRAEFEDCGVGLLGVSRRGVERLLPATRAGRSASSAVEMHCVERFWRGYATGS